MRSRADDARRALPHHDRRRRHDLRRVAHRGKVDGTPDVVRFAETLEQVCVETVEAGKMTKDLAILIGPDQPWLTTTQFLDALDAELHRRMEAAPAAATV